MPSGLTRTTRNSSCRSDQRPSRHLHRRDLYRAAYRGHHAGDLRVSPGGRLHRPALPGQGYARAVDTAQQTALEVLVANSIPTVIQQADGFTPTPVISRQILSYNRGRDRGLADGIVITPSHNPPTDGGFKYNPPNGGPADTESPIGFRIAPTNCCAIRAVFAGNT